MYRPCIQQRVQNMVLQGSPLPLVQLNTEHYHTKNYKNVRGCERIQLIGKKPLIVEIENTEAWSDWCI